jgi:tRNA(fMet)-specific endonuclease VapC
MTGNSYLLDTNILIALLKNDKNVVSKFNKKDTLYTSYISIGELYFGVYKSERIDDNTASIENLLSRCKICNISIDTSIYYGQIKAKLKKLGHPIPQNDI